MSDDRNVGDFADGQRDCRDGKPHQPGRSESYDMGYGFQYEMEQIRNAEGDAWRT